MKKLSLSVLAVATMAVALLLGASFFASEDQTTHPCDDAECMVCTVAAMINELPDAEDITIENAAAVMEQINQIDRMKSQLDIETRDADGMTEYDRMMAMVDDKDADKKADANKKSAKKDTIDKCDEAMNEIKHLETSDTFAVITKAFRGIDSEDVDWSQTDATMTIECIESADKNVTFNNGKPLEVTLGEIEGGVMEEAGFYTANNNGWTGKYPLPEGTYRITETDYNAVTLDGDNFTTTATYSVDGQKTKDNMIFTVREGTTLMGIVMNTDNMGELPGFDVNIDTAYITGDSDIDSIKRGDEYKRVEDVEIEVLTRNLTDSSEGDPKGYTIKEEICNWLVPDPGHDNYNNYECIIKVVTPPKGYYFVGEEESKFQFGGDGSVSLVDTPKGVVKPESQSDKLILLFEKTSASFQAIDIENSDAPMESIEIQVEDDNSNVFSGTSNADGLIEMVGDLAVGVEYTIVPPEGYELDSTYSTFIIKSDGTIETLLERGDNGEIILPFKAKRVDVEVSTVNEAGDALEDANIQILSENGQDVDNWVSNEEAQAVQGLTAGDYTLRVNSVPDGYYCCPDVDINIAADGTISEDSEYVTVEDKKITLTIPQTKVPISVVETFEDKASEPLSGVTVKILDGKGNPVNGMEWTSVENVTKHTFVGLPIEDEYTLVAMPPSGYYYEKPDEDGASYMEESLTIDSSGEINCGLEKDEETGSLIIKFSKVKKYYISLKDKITYGDPLDKLINIDASKKDGQQLLETEVYPPAGGIQQQGITGAYTLFLCDENDNPTSERFISKNKPGTYKITLVENQSGGSTEFTSNGPIMVEILPKELKESDFTVTAKDKKYDGTEEATFVTEIKQANRPAYEAGLEIKEAIPNPNDPMNPTFKYDDVTVNITGTFDSAEIGENKNVEYTINGLSGADAGNYVLSPATITGTTTASITEEAPVDTQPSTPSVTPEPELGCGITGNHAWGPWEKLDGTKHHRVCKNDPTHEETAKHTPSLKCGTDAKCTVCGAQGGDLHTFDMENWKANSENTGMNALRAEQKRM